MKSSWEPQLIWDLDFFLALLIYCIILLIFLLLHSSLKWLSWTQRNILVLFCSFRKLLFCSRKDMLSLINFCYAVVAMEIRHSDLLLVGGVSEWQSQLWRLWIHHLILAEATHTNCGCSQQWKSIMGYWCRPIISGCRILLGTALLTYFTSQVILKPDSFKQQTFCILTQFLRVRSGLWPRWFCLKVSHVL